jgi:hypothetical protein
MKVSYMKSNNHKYYMRCKIWCGYSNHTTLNRQNHLKKTSYWLYNQMIHATNMTACFAKCELGSKIIFSFMVFVSAYFLIAWWLMFFSQWSHSGKFTVPLFVSEKLSFLGWQKKKKKKKWQCNKSKHTSFYWRIHLYNNQKQLQQFEYILKVPSSLTA